jgi:hypothetical protein
MGRYKRRCLEAITEEMMRPYKELFAITVEGQSGTSDYRAKLQEFNELYRLTESFPTWPFTVEDLRKYHGWATAPLVAFIVGVAAGWVASLLG